MSEQYWKEKCATLSRLLDEAEAKVKDQGCRLHTAAEEVATANAAAHDMRELADEMTRQRDSISLRLAAIKKDADMQPLVHYVRYDDFKAIESRLEHLQRLLVSSEGHLENKHNALIAAENRLDNTLGSLEIAGKRIAELEGRLRDVGHAMEHAEEIGRMDHYAANTIKQALAVEKRCSFSDVVVTGNPPLRCDLPDGHEGIRNLRSE